MCSGPILSKMLLFSIPLMCSSILQLLFNAADIVVVGQFVGKNALAAVGSNTSLIDLLTNLFLGLSVGANVLVARYFGAKDKENIQKAVHTAMLLSLYGGIVLTVIGVAGAKYILVLMQTPKEVLPLAVTYLRIYFLGMTATMIYDFGSAVLRAIGDTQRPLYYLMAAGVINVILNLFFVIVLKMSVEGVAIATVISQIISAVLVVRCLLKEKSDIRLCFSKLHIDKFQFFLILRIGLPAGFQGTVFALSNVVIQSSINTFGSVVVAGNSAANNIEGFVYFAMNAFYQSTISFVSQNYGAGSSKRIKKILLIGQLCVIVVGLTVGNLAAVFGQPLMRIYSQNPQVIAAGMDRMQIVCRTYFLCGIMDVMVGGLRGIGYSVLPMIVSLVGACGLRLLWLATIFQINGFHTTQMIYISYPVSWFITLSVHIICFIWAMKHIKEKFMNDNIKCDIE